MKNKSYPDYLLLFLNIPPIKGQARLKPTCSGRGIGGQSERRREGPSAERRNAIPASAGRASSARRQAG
eukprot:7780506-Pyramimonas_sp.AAC.1